MTKFTGNMQNRGTIEINNSACQELKRQRGWNVCYPQGLGCFLDVNKEKTRVFRLSEFKSHREDKWTNIEEAAGLEPDISPTRSTSEKANRAGWSDSWSSEAASGCGKPAARAPQPESPDTASSRCHPDVWFPFLRIQEMRLART